MGGTAAKERRRLKRLALGGGGGDSTPVATKKDGVGGAQSPDGKKSRPATSTSSPFGSRRKRRRDEEGTDVRRKRGREGGGGGGGSGGFQKRRRAGAGPTEQSSKFSGRPKRKGEKGRSRANDDKQNDAAPKKKFKKPKHLKRKLAQLSEGGDGGNEKERSLLEDQRKKLEEEKARRSAAFEKRVRDLAGKNFDEDAFQGLREKGASLDAIMAAAGAKGGKRSKSKGKKDENREETEAKDKNSDERGGANRNANNSSRRDEAETPLLGDSSSADEPMVDKGPKNDKNKKATTPRAAGTVTETSPSDSDADSDEEGSMEQKRVRGRRRRGRKDADMRRAEHNAEAQRAAYESKTAAVKEAAADAGMEPNAKNASGDVASGDVATSAKKTPKKDDKRRCKGRKPVTDYEVGKRYDGKVVYLKPFGVFIDIGCHSDAFCHVSRVQDDYVASPSEVLKGGDAVSARVVEVDRKKKRITVSLQSDARLEDERRSQQRREESKEKKAMSEAAGESHSDAGVPVQVENEVTHRTGSSDPTSVDGRDGENVSSLNSMVMDESNMTPAELKRARKLARRAERRKQKEVTGLSA